MRKSEKARQELTAMMDSIKRDYKSWFGMGKFACKKKLANGAVVRVSITMPPLKKAAPVRKSAQEKAYEDIEAGRVPHNKHTCPGCPIH